MEDMEKNRTLVFENQTVRLNVLHELGVFLDVLHGELLVRS